MLCTVQGVAFFTMSDFTQLYTNRCRLEGQLSTYKCAHTESINLLLVSDLFLP